MNIFDEFMKEFESMGSSDGLDREDARKLTSMAYRDAKGLNTEALFAIVHGVITSIARDFEDGDITKEKFYGFMTSVAQVCEYALVGDKNTLEVA